MSITRFEPLRKFGAFATFFAIKRRMHRGRLAQARRWYNRATERLSLANEKGSGP